MQEFLILTLIVLKKYQIDISNITVKNEGIFNFDFNCAEKNIK